MGPSPARIHPTLLTALLAASCGQAAPDGSELASALTLTGPDGSQLLLAGPAQRILPTNASAADYVLSLAGPARLVALPHTADSYSSTSGALDPLPLLNDYTAEEVLALDPDLVVTHEWQSHETTALLREHGLAVLVIPDLVEVEDYERTLSALGQALGAEDGCERLLEGLTDRVRALRADHARAGVRALTYTNYGTGGFTAGMDTSADLLLRLAGLENAAATAGVVGNAAIEYERLLKIDPDVIVVSSTAERSALAPSARLLAAERALAGLTALRAGRVVELPARLFSASSPQIVEAAELLALEVDRAYGRRPPGSDEE